MAKDTTDALFGIDQQEERLSAHELKELKLLEEIYSKQDIELKTDLTMPLVKAVTKGQLFAEKYQSKLMSDLTNRLMILLVSNKRQGRKEFIEMSKSLNSAEEMPVTMSERLLGVGR
jgi:hypothetical protein